MNILSLDIGTTNLRGIVYNAQGEQLASHAVSLPPALEGGRFEQRPQAYVEGVTEVCRQVASRVQVDAIVLTAFRSSPTLVDKQGEPLCNFILWQDTRCAQICQRLRAQDDWVYAKTGSVVNTVFAAPKVTWLRENNPDLYARSYKMMVVPDYLLHKLTGAFVTDYTYGSRTSLMDIHTCQWDSELCRLFAIDQQKLCRLVAPGSVVGPLLPRFASTTGLSAGIPVISAGGDQQCGALGMGVLDASAMEVNCGTGSFLLSITDELRLDNKAVLCNIAAIPGFYVREINALACASCVDWLLRSFFPELNGASPDYATLNRLAASAPPGAHGLYCLPHFAGCGARDWNPEAKAAFWGLTLASSRSDIVRALYEGLAAEIVKGAILLDADRKQALTVSGGLSRSEPFCQILCDMAQRPLRRCRTPQATAFGAFLSACVALGVYPSFQAAVDATNAAAAEERLLPNTQNAALYRAYLQQTEAVYRALNGTPCVTPDVI